MIEARLCRNLVEPYSQTTDLCMK